MHLEKLANEDNLVYRPWGWYKNIQGSDYFGFKVKLTGVYSGKRLSLQSHQKKSRTLDNCKRHWKS